MSQDFLLMQLKRYIKHSFHSFIQSSPIVYSIGNSIIKNFTSEHFFIKVISDEIWCHIHIWRHVTSYMNITSYLGRYQFYRKIVRVKVFQYEISDRMSYWWTFYDNFENSRKMTFWWEMRNQNCLCADRKKRLFRIFFHKISYNKW